MIDADELLEDCRSLVSDLVEDLRGRSEDIACIPRLACGGSVRAASCRRPGDRGLSRVLAR